jgi:hypothetical protein
MQKDLSLEVYYQQYVCGKLSKKELEGIIFRVILKNYKRFRLYSWSEGECIDYLCWLYPRISRTIDRYKSCGSSFDRYIRSLVRWSSKEYYAKESNQQLMESAYLDTTVTEMEVSDPEPEYPEPEGDLNPVSNPRQILILLLKSYYHVSEDFIGRIAPVIGIEKEKLCLMIDMLRNRRYERDERIRLIRERLHSLYYRCIHFERRLLTLTEGSVEEIRIRRCLEKGRLRIRTLRERLKSIRLDATNRQVAEILGVPKGTVDSSLFAIKSREKISVPGAGKKGGSMAQICNAEGPADFCFGLN